VPYAPVKEGTVRDPVTGKLQRVDEWGRVIYEDDPNWGVPTWNLGGNK
jgi:hypothetical protein